MSDAETPTNPAPQADENTPTEPTDSTPAPVVAESTPAAAVPPPPPAPVAVTAPAKPAKPAIRADGFIWGLGRRKSAVARVRIKPGTGKILINKKEVAAYFTEMRDRNAVTEPLTATDAVSKYDVFVNVGGGGYHGQADAVRLGVARALLRADGKFEAVLREKNYLTRDSRVVERKKYGRRKARRRFQFSKR